MIGLISIHIPKTGGRSFRRVLETIYGQTHFSYYDRKDVLSLNGKLSQNLPKDTSVIHGHFYFSEVADIYMRDSPPVITWVRDPVERVISNYYFFIKRVRSGVEPNLLHRRNESLIEYARLKECRNKMSVFLEGIRLEKLAFIGFLEYFEEDLQYLSTLLGWRQVTLIRVNDNSDYRSQFEPPTEEVLSEIRALNRQDIELYEQAVNLRKERRN